LYWSEDRRRRIAEAGTETPDGRMPISCSTRLPAVSWTPPGCRSNRFPRTQRVGGDGAGLPAPAPAGSSGGRRAGDGWPLPRNLPKAV